MDLEPINRALEHELLKIQWTSMLDSFNLTKIDMLGFKSYQNFQDKLIKEKLKDDEKYLAQDLLQTVNEIQLKQSQSTQLVPINQLNLPEKPESPEKARFKQVKHSRNIQMRKHDQNENRYKEMQSK